MARQAPKTQVLVDEPVKVVALRLKASQHRQLRIKAASEDKSVQEVLRALVDDYISR